MSLLIPQQVHFAYLMECLRGTIEPLNNHLSLSIYDNETRTNLCLCSFHHVEAPSMSVPMGYSPAVSFNEREMKLQIDIMFGTLPWFNKNKLSLLKNVKNLKKWLQWVHYFTRNRLQTTSDQATINQAVYQFGVEYSHNFYYWITSFNFLIPTTISELLKHSLFRIK